MDLDSIRIVAYGPEWEALWDDACLHSANATFLHSRRFLSYHGDRFVDRSLLITIADKVVGVFAAAQSPSDATLVVSHPGSTYGGIVHAGALCGSRMMHALNEICAFYRSQGYARLRYKVVPSIYQTRPAQDDLYALFRQGATRSRCDLSCAIDLKFRDRVSERRRRGLKKALKSVVITDDSAQADALWKVLVANLERKHGAMPVHTIDEMQMLIGRFPDQIGVVSAEVNGKVEAGIVVFKTQLVWHAQYIASSEIGYAVSALDAVFDRVIESASNGGLRYFDFGTSNENEGTFLNDGLYQYKHEYGGGGIVHEFYDINLLETHHAFS